MFDSAGEWRRVAGGTAALDRMLTLLIDAPTHYITIRQEPNGRYVQLMIGRGHDDVTDPTASDGNRPRPRAAT